MSRWFNSLFGKRSSSSDPKEDILTAAETAALLEGDKAVLGKFIHAALPIVRGAVRRVLSRRSHHDAMLEEDLTQDVIDRLLSSLNSVVSGWDAQKGKLLRSYLNQWAIWRIRDLLRSPKYPSRRMGGEEEILSIPALDQAPPIDRLWSDLRQLFDSRASDEQKELYQQVYVQEKSTKELAQAAGISEMTQHQRVHRLRQFFLALYEELYCDDEEIVRRKKRGALVSKNRSPHAD
jgi:RNA polymerase sigma factor (sigma-70 family)